MEILLTGILMLTLLIISLYGVRYTSITEHFFDKDYTTLVKAISCIIVILVHIPAAYSNRLQNALGSFGYVAVTLFFLISAYGLKYSIIHKKNYLNHFWRNRLIALLVPFYMVRLFTSIPGLILKKPYKIQLLIPDEFVLTFIVCYILFYLVYRFINIRNKDFLLCLLILASSLLTKYTDIALFSKWPTESLGFVWGILLANHLKPFVDWVKKNYFIKVTSLMMIAGLLGIAYLKFKNVDFAGDYLLKIGLAFFIIAFILSASAKLKLGNRATHFLGSISFEVYLSHGWAMYVVGAIPYHLPSGLFIISSVILTIIISAIIHFFSERLISMIRV